MMTKEKMERFMLLVENPVITINFLRILAIETKIRIKDEIDNCKTQEEKDAVAMKLFDIAMDGNILTDIIKSFNEMSEEKKRVLLNITAEDSFDIWMKPFVDKLIIIYNKSSSVKEN